MIARNSRHCVTGALVVMLRCGLQQAWSPFFKRDAVIRLVHNSSHAQVEAKESYAVHHLDFEFKSFEAPPGVTSSVEVTRL
jgi:hypothetical protein